jgi:hypothetical protein
VKETEIKPKEENVEEIGTIMEDLDEEDIGPDFEPDGNHMTEKVLELQKIMVEIEKMLNAKELSDLKRNFDGNFRMVKNAIEKQMSG